MLCFQDDADSVTSDCDLTEDEVHEDNTTPTSTVVVSPSPPEFHSPSPLDTDTPVAEGTCVAGMPDFSLKAEFSLFDFKF